MLDSAFPESFVDIEARTWEVLATRQTACAGGSEIKHLYQQRLSRELEYIYKTGLAPYISSVTELIDHARSLGIIVGPGRNSAPSSLVLYLLGITQVDPIANGLIVERWFSYPTIEIDVEWHRRKELIDYLWGRYGFEHTAYISTYKRDKESGEILSRGVHAASYAISSTPIMDFLPTWTAADGRLVVDAEREDVEARGIGIFTILGMKQLSVIGETVARITRAKPDFAIKRIPEEDATTMGLFKTGNTADIFQFDFQNMRETLSRAQAESRGDLAILSAVHRPPFVVDGMMSELINRMVAKNNLPESAKHMFPEDMLSEVSGVKDDLAASFGLMIFQEQFLEIVRRLSGWDYLTSELYRYRVKQYGATKELQDEFLEAARNGVDLSESQQQQLRTLITRSRSTVLKSHQISYVHIGWSMAYLKANYPDEFEASTAGMRSDSNPS